MIFVTLVKFRAKPTKDTVAENLKLIEAEKKEGLTYLSVYWTLGRYDAIVTLDAPDEKTLMRAMLRRGWASTETLVAVPAEEARKLVEA